jgi:hypothetical protein
MESNRMQELAGIKNEIKQTNPLLFKIATRFIEEINKDDVLSRYGDKNKIQNLIHSDSFNELLNRLHEIYYEIDPLSILMILVEALDKEILNK